jgi:hypothetical protein
MLTRILVVVALLAPTVGRHAGAQTVQDVNVVNTPAIEVVNTPTVEVANVAGAQPFQKRFLLDIFANQYNDFATFAVPPGKILVIEFVSVHSWLPAAQTFYGKVTTVAGGTAAVFYFRSEPLGDQFSQVDQRAVSSPTRIYADPGTNVQLLVERSHVSGSMTSIDFSISGHLLNVP